VQSKMENPETNATLGTETVLRQAKHKHNTWN